MKKRIRLFESCIVPCILYATSTLSTTLLNLEFLDIVQHKMIRKMIGYGPHPDYDWEATMRNMKFKMEQVFSSFRIKNWSEIILTRKFQWACKIINMDTRRWAQIISTSTYFEEAGYRKRGRPKM